jgi:isopenicillin N synthase-like dioxygenase
MRYTLISLIFYRAFLLQCFTILWQQPGIQALQVLNSSKEWINAPAIEGTLVIKWVD